MCRKLILNPQSSFHAFLVLVNQELLSIRISVNDQYCTAFTEIQKPLHISNT
jgi:hypothetical protein